MFAIGTGLREARERRGLALAEVERDTRISARWLRALEEENFDLLPERVYALGFIRTYADFLGLDGQQFVDELSSRLPPEEELEVPLPDLSARRGRLSGWRILAAMGLLAVAAVVIARIGFGGSSTHTPSSPTPSARATTTAPATTPPAKPRTKPRVARLVLTAAHGRCWLDARLGSQNGRELRMGTLELQQSISLSGKRIWIRLGAPTALDAMLNGRKVVLPSTTPVNVVVTAAGIRAAP
jgi:cytoskeleton protein RodZ